MGELYCIEHGKKQITTMLGSGEQSKEPVQWMAETGIIGTSSPDQKYISRLTIRMSLATGARVLFFAQYNSMGDWEPLGAMSATTLRSFSVPIRPKRCDHLKLRIVGVGEARIYSITKTIEQGSELS
jgi:hypothetical protein